MAIAYVQSNKSFTGNSTSSATPFLSNNTAGNFLVAAAIGFGTVTISSIADTLGNNWSLVSQQTLADGTIYYLYAVTNCKGGANTVTITLESSNQPMLLVAEYSGISLTSPLDQLAASTEGASGSYTSGSVTTTVANELLIGVLKCTGGVAATIVPAAGWTERQQERSATVPDIVLLDNIVSSIGTYANSGTFSTSVPDNGALIATFKAQASAPSGGPGTGLPPFGWVNTQGDHYNKRGLR